MYDVLKASPRRSRVWGLDRLVGCRLPGRAHKKSGGQGDIWPRIRGNNHNENDGSLGEGSSGRAGRACGLSTISHVHLRATLPASTLPLSPDEPTSGEQPTRPGAGSREPGQEQTSQVDTDRQRPASGRVWRADLLSWRRRACPPQ